MNTSDWAAALAAFDAWQDATPPARDALLAGLAPDLRTRVQALIAADGEAEAHDFLGGHASDLLPAEPGLAGLRLGAWTLTEPLGSGGMGEVWRARRSDGAHQGEAAIKLLHSPWRGAQAQARFRREGELLARLTHPHIAQLLDVGEAPVGGIATRYLVLELVQGERIDHWCEARGLDVAARLHLFLQVCDAVAHAHTRLVVHRDLKPGNILVTADGQVKLLDFGVAKLLAEDTDVELTRQAAAGLTPEYAAPEQLRGEPVGTATDVFALGRLLCLLLTGSREPGPALRGELALIVAHATRARPDERYPGASALADDLRRHLAHQPIRARPDSLAYRSAKFARRHRLQLAALGLVGASLLAGVAATTWQWREATRETERTRRVQSVLTELLGGLSPDASGSATVPMLELLRRSWAEAQARLAGDDALLAEVARPLGLLLAQAGDAALAAHTLALSQAHLQASGQTGTRAAFEVDLELAGALRRLGREPEARALLQALLQRAERQPSAAAEFQHFARVNLGELALEAGRPTEARALLLRAAQDAEAAFSRQHRAYVKAADLLASLARSEGRWDEARRWFAAVAAAAGSDRPVDAALARMSAATLEVEVGRYAQAVPLLRASVAELTRVQGASDLNTVFARTWLATALAHHGEAGSALQEARAAWQQAQATASPDAPALVELVLARLELRQGQVAAAEPRLRRLLARFEADGADSRAEAERARALLGEAQLRQGRADLALPLLTAADHGQQALLGPRHTDRWPTLALLALALQARGDAAAAGRALAEAQALVQAGLPDEHPDRPRLQALVALLAWVQAAGQRPQALAALQAHAQSLQAHASASQAGAQLLQWAGATRRPTWADGLRLLNP